MHRCFIEPDRWNEHQIAPSTKEAHHLRDVLRAEDGDNVTLFDGRGHEAHAVVQIDATGDLLLLVNKVQTVAERAFDIILVQAVPKGSRMDTLVEKATELGVARIIPIITDRSVVRLDSKQAAKRADRWDRIARSAAKQCGTQWLPQIDPVCNFADALSLTSEFDALLLGSLVNGVQPLHVVTESLKTRNPRSVAVMIGPEGDFTPSETDAAVESGAIPVSFGGLTLRVETAALYIASVLAHEFLWRS